LLKIKYAYDTRIITQVSRKDKGPYGRRSQRSRNQYPEGAWHFQTKSATVNRRYKIAVLRQEFEEKYVSSKLIARAYSI